MSKRIQGGVGSGAAVITPPKTGGPVALQPPALAPAKGEKAVQASDIFNMTPKMVEAQRVHEPIPVSSIKGIQDLQQIKPGDFTSLSGRVVNKDPLKINNDGPPGGAYLALDNPVVLTDADGKKFEVREIFISLDQVTQSSCGTRGNNCGSCSVATSCQVGKKLPEDRKLTVHGQIGTMAFGGQGGSKAPGFVVGVGGISVQGKDRKEPLYKEDKQFHDPETKHPLETLRIENPVIKNPTINTPPGYKHPDAELVFAKEPTPKDPNRMVVWVGKTGGGNDFLGDFHGFSGFHVPRPPNAEEKAAVKFGSKGPGDDPMFNSDDAPRVKHGNKWVSTEPIGIAQGQTWFLDRKGDRLYGATMKKAPESGYELTSVVRFAKDDIINGEAAPPPHGFFTNPDGSPPIDGRELGHGPRDAASKEVREKPVFIARRIDPKKVEGPGGWYTNFIGPNAKNPEVASYGSLRHVAGSDGLIRPDDFKKKLREIATEIPGGADVVKQIKQVMADAETEYKAGRAAEPPTDKEAWFDFLLDSYMHAHDLRIWMKGMGFASEGTSMHDLTEMVPLKDVEWQMKDRYTEPWFANYVANEKAKGMAAGLKEDEIMLNCSFLNPNYAAAGYTWGFAALGANDIMNLHRLSCHHSGNTHEEIYWVEKAMNFMIHHVPLEDFGVRHEEAGMFTRLVEEGIVTKEELAPENLSEDKMFVLLEKSLNHALEHDPAMKTSQIGKAIIHDAFQVWKELARKGYVQPWQLTRPRQSAGEFPMTPKLEGSYRQLQMQTRAAKQMFNEAAKTLNTPPAGVAATAAEKGKAIAADLTKLRDGLSVPKIDTKAEVDAIANKAMTSFRALRDSLGATPSDDDKKLLDAAAHATIAAFGIMAVVNEHAAVAFTDPQKELQASLLTAPPANAPNTFLSKEDLLRAIDEMKRVPEKIERAHAAGEETVAGQIKAIYDFWKNGFVVAPGVDERLANAPI